MKKIYNTKKVMAVAAIGFMGLVTSNAYAQCTPPPAPVAIGTIACVNNSVNVSATGTGSVFSWFALSNGGFLADGNPYTTPSLTSDTTYYVAQYSVVNNGSLSLPPQSSPFSGNSRGYFFIAPTNMTLTGVRVPTDAGTGNYNVAVLKLAAVPPLFSNVTNSFTTLHLTQNGTGTAVVPVNIPIGYGDVIGVLGDRAGSNSYSASGPFTNVSFGTHTVTLTRMGMQFPLATTAPKDIWQEATGAISRVELYADLACMSPLAAAEVTVSSCTGIEEMFGDDFIVSPNPASDHVNLKVSERLIGNASIELFDALGKSVLKENVTEKQIRINTSQLSPGIYIYKVYTGKKMIKTDKLIKQ